MPTRLSVDRSKKYILRRMYRMTKGESCFPHLLPRVERLKLLLYSTQILKMRQQTRLTHAVSCCNEAFRQPQTRIDTRLDLNKRSIQTDLRRLEQRASRSSPKVCLLQRRTRRSHALANGAPPRQCP